MPDRSVTDPPWVKALRDIEWDLVTAVLDAPPERVAPLNMAVQRVRQAIPHEFAKGWIPRDLCAWCWLPQDEHIIGDVS